MTPTQKCPTQWTKYLQSEENKEDLVSFLHSEWSKEEYLLRLNHLNLYITVGSDCYCIYAHGSVIHKNIVQELCSTQEEADTRMFLHAAHATEQGFSDIVIKSSDTDIEVLAMYYQKKLASRLIVVSGTRNKL